jgi:hypothetical protein
MSEGFTKLFSSLIGSSIWSEDNNTRVLWITILAITDGDGFCNATIPGLAAMARLSVEDVEASMTKLEGADEYSRSRENDGRRIERVDGGWMVLNYGKYRDRDRTERRKEYMREFMRKKRENGGDGGVGSENPVSLIANGLLTVSNCSASSSVSVSESSGDKRGKGGKGCKGAETDFWAEMREIYTWLDVDRERAKMQAWLKLHPGRTLTKRFAVNWMNKEEAGCPVEGIKAEKGTGSRVEVDRVSVGSLQMQKKDWEEELSQLRNSKNWTKETLDQNPVKRDRMTALKRLIAIASEELEARISGRA